VSLDRLIDALWADAVPPDAAGAVASIVSKLRTAFRRAGGDGPSVISGGAGTYQLRLEPGGSIDLEDCREAIDRAEGARRAEDAPAAWSFATVAVAISRRGFLPGESADWVLGVQRELQGITRRGYTCLSWVWAVRGDGELATRMAEAALEADLLHEPCWRNLMTVHARFGNRADAVRTFERCRELLGDELGVAPDGETVRLCEQLLAS
jgi:DNA-binding SARP family transcriptional activator